MTKLMTSIARGLFGSAIRDVASQAAREATRETLKAVSDGLALTGNPLTLEALADSLQEFDETQRELAEAKTNEATEERKLAEAEYFDAVQAAEAKRSVKLEVVNAVQAEGSAALELAGKAKRIIGVFSRK